MDVYGSFWMELATTVYGHTSTVETLDNGNASMRNEDIYIMGMNPTIPDKQTDSNTWNNWNYFYVPHLMIL